MKLTIAIAAILTVMISATATVFLLSRQDNSELLDKPQSAASAPNDTFKYSEMTIEDIRQMDKDQQCDFIHPSYNVTSHFTHDKRFQYQLIDQESGEIDSYTVVGKDMEYLWQASEKQGISVVLPIEEDVYVAGEEALPYISGFITSSEKFDFTCTEWRVDESIFTPPADVIFTNWKDIWNN